MLSSLFKCSKEYTSEKFYLARVMPTQVQSPSSTDLFLITLDDNELGPYFLAGSDRFHPGLLECGEEVTVSLEEGPVPRAGAAQAVCWREANQTEPTLVSMYISILPLSLQELAPSLETAQGNHIPLSFVVCVAFMCVYVHCSVCVQVEVRSRCWKSSSSLYFLKFYAFEAIKKKQNHTSFREKPERGYKQGNGIMSL